MISVKPTQGKKGLNYKCCDSIGGFVLTIDEPKTLGVMLIISPHKCAGCFSTCASSISRNETVFVIMSVSGHVLQV
jgi:hypothetical protein